MQHEAALRLDRAAQMHRHVGRIAGVDIEVIEQLVQPDARDQLAHAQPQRPLGIMHAHRDYGMGKARIGHARHRQQQPPGEILAFDHDRKVRSNFALCNAWIRA